MQWQCGRDMKPTDGGWRFEAQWGEIFVGLVERIGSRVYRAIYGILPLRRSHRWLWPTWSQPTFKSPTKSSP